MELKLVSEKGQTTAGISASDSLFGRQYNEALVHQIVTSYLSNARGGNRAQKGRSEVSKSTRKPWRQKGTGRARVGAASSPLWRGGGIIFPNSPIENFTKKVNRKMYRAGMSVIVSRLAQDDRLLVIDSLNVTTSKTKELALKLKGMKLSEVLIVTHEIDENLSLSSRNLPRVSVVEAKNIDPISLLRFEKVLITTEGLKKLEELFS